MVREDECVRSLLVGRESIRMPPKVQRMVSVKIEIRDDDETKRQKSQVFVTRWVILALPIHDQSRWLGKE